MKKIVLIVATIIFSYHISFGQLEGIDPDYLKTLNGRAGKIVDELNLNDKEQAERVKQIIVVQYFELSKIHDARDAKLEEIKNLEGEAKEKAKSEIHNGTDANLYKLHAAYLAKLSAELTQDQVEQVKDGMTYGVVKHTYTGYMNLLPDLTAEQKRYIYANLVEAREFAMDAGSSKAKHGWFGKYKGRINNYLSAAGYDMKKAEEDLKARQQKGKK
jgi:hypothetical protein